MTCLGDVRDRKGELAALRLWHLGGIEERRAIERGDGAVAGADEPAPTPEDHGIADWLRIAIENRDLRPGKAL